MPIADVEHNPWEAASAPAVDITVKPYGSAAAPTGQVADVAHNPWEMPSVPLDVAKSAGSGLATGLAGAAGITPTIIGGVAQGLMKLNEMAGDPLRYISPGGTGLEQAEANKQAIAQAVGRPSYDYTPQTTSGAFFKTGGEYLGNTIGAGGPLGVFKGTPGQIAKQVVGQVAVPAVASETAGQIYEGTPIEPYARAAAGLATGAVGAGLTGGVQQGLTREQVLANAKTIYKSPELKAAEFAPQSIGTFADAVEQQLKAQNFSRVNMGPAYTALDNLKAMASNNSATFANVRAVDKALTRAGREVGPNGVPTENAAAATVVKQNIRGYLDTLTPADLVKGDATKIGPLLRAANQDYATQSAAFELPRTLRKAQNFAKQNDIPIEEALALRAKNLTPEERAQAAKAITGGIVTKGVRLAAMADPTKSPLALGAHTLGAYATGGASLPLSSVGTAAGRLSDFLKESQIKQLRQNILNRSYLASTLPPVPPPLGVAPRALIGGVLGGYGGALDRRY